MFKSLGSVINTFTTFKEIKIFILQKNTFKLIKIDSKIICILLQNIYNKCYF